MDGFFGSGGGGGDGRFRRFHSGGYGAAPWFDIVMLILTATAVIAVLLHLDAVTEIIAAAFCQIILLGSMLLIAAVVILLLVLVFRIAFYRRRWY